MSSKRKSPPTKLDGSNGTSEHKPNSDEAPSAEIDLSLKSSPKFNDDDHRVNLNLEMMSNTEMHNHTQLNGERADGKAKRRGGDIQVNIQNLLNFPFD